MSRYIGNGVKPSRFNTSGLISLQNHQSLVQDGDIPIKPRDFPSLNQTDVYFPSNEFLQLASNLCGATISGGSGNWVDPSGNYFFTASSSTLYRYRFTKQYDYTSISATPDQSRTLVYVSNQAMTFKPDGTKLYVAGDYNAGVHILELNLGVAFDITTITWTGKVLDLELYNIPKSTSVTSITFSSDGTKIYITSAATNRISSYQIDLATAWDISSTATFYAMTKDTKVALQTINGISFSSTGDRYYLVDSYGANRADRIMQFHLATAWDLTTTKTNQFDIKRYIDSAENAPGGAVFNNDGTKFYLVGNSIDNVYELSLSTPYDINTATHNANVKTYYTSLGEANRSVYSFWFKDDGTKLFVVDTSDTIIEYTFDTAWDPTTIKYSNSFSISAQESDTRDMFFKSDGTKLYITGQSGDDVNEYSLSTAWDISTASYVQSFSFSGQETAPNSLAFSSDGTKMFVMGQTGDDINEYALSTAWDISTASYTQVKSFSVAGFTGTMTTPQSMMFNASGTAVYMINNAANTNGLTKFSLSSAWDISTMSYDSSEYFNAYATPSNHRTRFNSDGTALFYMYDGTTTTTEYISEIPLTTAYNINTAQWQNSSLMGNETIPTGLAWGDSGNYLYVVGSTGDAVDQFEVLEPYSVCTARYLRTFSVSGQETVPQSVFFKSDGTRMYVIGSTGDDINQYNLSTAWDISTASYNALFSVATQDTVPAGFCFSSDGTKMYVVGQTNDRIYAYILGTAWDVTTAQLANSVDASYPDYLDISYFANTPTGLAIKADGTSLYITGQGQDCVNQIDLAVAYKLIPADIFSVADKETLPTAVEFKTDGTKMYVVGSTSDNVHEYDLSTAWDISTAAFNQSFAVGGQETAPNSIAFSSDGTKMFIAGATGDDVNTYTLSTAWDISTASYTRVFSISAQELTVTGMYWKSDGLKFWIIGSNSDAVFQYSLSSAWDTTTASYDSKSYALSLNGHAETTIPGGIYFKSDGTRFYYYDQTNARLISHAMSTAWDISTVSSPILRVTTNTYFPFSLSFSPDGDVLYIQEATTGNIYNGPFRVYQLSTPWELGTAILIGSTASQQPIDMTVDATGRYMLGRNRSTNNLMLYTIPNKGYVSNNVVSPVESYDYVSQTLVLTSKDTAITAFTFDSTGTKMYFAGTSSDSIHYYALSSAWDLSTASFVSTLDLSASITSPYAIRFIQDGKYLLVFCQDRASVTKFELSTPWDITTATVANVGQTIAPTMGINFTSTTRLDFVGAYFSFDGTMLYLNHDYEGTMQFRLNGDHDIENFTPSRVSFNSFQMLVQATTASRSYFCLSESGEYFYTMVAWSGSAAVEQWQLSSPYVIDQDMKLIFRFDLYPEFGVTNQAGMHLSPDGTRLYILGTSNNRVVEYTLGTPWQISTAGSATTFSVASQTTTSVGLEFNTDGTKMFVASNTDKTVYEYALSSAWDISTASYNNVTLNATSDLIYYKNVALDTMVDMNFNGDGTKLILVFTNNLYSLLYTYTLSSAWDLSTASFDNIFDYSTSYLYNGRTAKKLAFADEGRFVYFWESSAENSGVDSYLIGHRLNTPYDITTIDDPNIGHASIKEILSSGGNRSVLSENGQIQLNLGSSGYHYLTSVRLSSNFDLRTKNDRFVNIMKLAYGPGYAFMDATGQHAFYSRGGYMYKLDLSGIN